MGREPVQPQTILVTKKLTALLVGRGIRQLSRGIEHPRVPERNSVDRDRDEILPSVGPYILEFITRDTSARQHEIGTTCYNRHLSPVST